MHNVYLELLCLVLLAGMWLGERRSGDPGLTRRAYLVGIWGGLLGSRIWYSLQYGGWTLTGGMASWGFLFGAGLASVGYLRWRKGRCDFGDFADAVAPGLALGGVVMRIGCFVVGCNFGKPTDLPWAVVYGPGTPAFIKQSSRGLVAEDALQTLPTHPTQLYEAAFLAVLFWLVTRSSVPRRLRGGELFLGGILAYSVFRFLVEFVRDDAGGLFFGPLTFAQGNAILAGLLMLTLILTLRRRNVWTQADQPLEVS